MRRWGSKRWAALTGSTFVRWSLAIAAGFATMTLVLFAFIYWQTAVHEQVRIDGLLMRESQALVAGPPDGVGAALEAWVLTDPHGQLYGGLFGADGIRLAGNLLAVPKRLEPDGLPHRAIFGPIGRDHDGDDPEVVRGVATRLPDQRLLVIGYDVDELEEVDDVVGRALLLSLLPMVLLSLLGGVLLAMRAQRRIGEVHVAVDRIMGGAMQERLPIHGTGDELDKVSVAVNRMLDRVERLVDELRGVGDSIAHDLRTPLTRVRTRLERSRDEARTLEEFRSATDRAIGSVDAALVVVSAILRIGQVEYGRRHAEFRPLDLAGILEDAVELYAPIAEERAIRLEIAATATPPIMGDRDLMLEAVGNLLDNAVKFAPSGSVVVLSAAAQGPNAVLRVTDRGQGIPPEERERVLQRFYRMEKSRTVAGNGLGLSLVAAIVRLHGFTLRIGDAAPGCVVEIECPEGLQAGAVAVPGQIKADFSLPGPAPTL